LNRKRAELAAAAVAAVSAGVVLRSWTVVALAIPLVTYAAIAGMIDEPLRLSVSARREEGSGKIFEGGSFEVSVTLENDGSVVGLLRAEDMLPRGLRVVSGSNVGFSSLSRGGRAQLRYRVTSDAPGHFELGPLLLSAADRFGLRSDESVVNERVELDVLPRIERRRDVSFRPRRTRNWSGQIASPRPGAGQDFYAIRQYIFGDPARVVNWKAWARLDRMYSNEFMSELGADAVVIVDKSAGSDFGTPPESALTYVDRCAAAVCGHLLSEGNRIGVMVIADRVRMVNPGTGRNQLQRILLTLVRSKSGRPESIKMLPDYLAFWFPRATNVIVVSSLGDPDIVEPLLGLGATRDLYVVSPSFAGRKSPADLATGEEKVAYSLIQLRRGAMYEYMRRFAQVVDWDVDSPVEAVLQRAFPRRGRVGAR
jgi:uncharacterized protein (DUF58 family)